MTQQTYIGNIKLQFASSHGLNYLRILKLIILLGKHNKYLLVHIVFKSYTIFV